MWTCGNSESNNWNYCKCSCKTLYGSNRTGAGPLWGYCMFSPFLCRFPPGTLVSPTIKSCTLNYLPSKFTWPRHWLKSGVGPQAWPLPTTVSGGEYQFHHDVHCMICDLNILLLLIEVTMNESILFCVNCCISSNVNWPEVYCVIKHIYKIF